MLADINTMSTICLPDHLADLLLDIAASVLNRNSPSCRSGDRPGAPTPNAMSASLASAMMNSFDPCGSAWIERSLRSSDFSMSRIGRRMACRWPCRDLLRRTLSIVSRRTFAECLQAHPLLGPQFDLDVPEDALAARRPSGPTGTRRESGTLPFAASKREGFAADRARCCARRLRSKRRPRNRPPSSS